MKALSIRQPWAHLIAHGLKTIECRDWQTNHRGPLAIHASATAPMRLDLQFLMMTQGGIDLRGQTLHRGKIVATCRLEKIITFDDESFRRLTPLHLCAPTYYKMTHFGWVLSDVRLLKQPIPAKGRLGLWEVDVINESP